MFLSLRLNLAKASVPVLSAAFGAAATWFYHTTYSSPPSKREAQEPRSDGHPAVCKNNQSNLSSNPMPVTPTPPPSNEEGREQPHYTPDDRSSVQQTNLSSNPMPVTPTTPPPREEGQEQPRYNSDNRMSLRENKQPKTTTNSTTFAVLTRNHDGPGLELGIVKLNYRIQSDRITDDHKAILKSLSDSVDAFPLEAILNTDEEIEWSTRNLGLITEKLHSLWKALGDGQRCSRLTIQLPSDRVEVTDETGIFSLTRQVLLPYGLHVLEWTGNREQLPMFFQDQPGVSTLVDLTIDNTTLSLDDCLILMSLGSQTLRSLTFRTIRAVDLGMARASLPPLSNSVQTITMDILTSLTIESAIDLDPWYRAQARTPLLRFPKLRSVTARISDPDFDILAFRRWVTIGGTQRILVNWDVWCNMSPEQLSKMRDYYPDATLDSSTPYV